MNEEQPIKLKAPFIVVLVVILIGGFMSMLDSSIVNVALAAMMSAFGVGADEIDWVLTIYMLVLGVSVPTSGWLGDYFGLKKVYLLSLTIFTIGEACCALAWNVPSLTVARGIQAVGGGMIMPLTMAMIYKITPRKNIGKAMAGYGMVFVVAPAIGPTVGGYLVQYVDWRWIFTINLPIGVIGILLGIWIIPAMEGIKVGKFDVWGAILSAAGLFSILLVLSEGSGWGWTSQPTILLIYASCVFMGLFIWWELKNPEPLLDLRIFKNINFTMGNLALVLITIGMYGVLFYIPIFLQAVRGMGALEAGLLMLPPALVSAVSMPISGALYDRFGPRYPAAIGVVLLAFSTYMFSYIDLATPVSFIIFWNSVRSVGMGLAMMPVQTALMSEILQLMVARASAMNNIISRVSGSFGIAIWR
jgi:EmrB/QacA subfamily drug resistance transporter